MPAHQVRRARPDTPLLRALLQRGDELRVIGKTEVIVAAEREISLPIHDDMRRLRTGQRAPAAQQAQRLAFVEFGL